jgi:ABC-2 type transport system permease protein
MLMSLVLANLKLIYRDRQAAFWAIAFPLIFLLIFGLFNFNDLNPVEIVVIDHAGNELSEGLIADLDSLEFLELEAGTSEADARREIVDGNLKYLLIIPEGLDPTTTPGDLTLIYDESEFQTNQLVEGLITRFLDGVNLRLQDVEPLLGLKSQGIQGRPVEYFDFLLPGLIGMGVMTFSIIGMGTTMAQYRQQRILRRIQATPLKVRTFFIAQVLAWLMLSLVQTAIIMTAGTIIFDAVIYGNYFWVLPLVILANLTFLNLGFIVGSLSKSVQAASGLGNLLTMPMMFFSGVFFPADSLPSIMSNAVKYLPLTPLLEALRGVLLDAQPLWDFPMQLGLLAGWVVVTAIIAVKTFKFE